MIPCKKCSGNKKKKVANAKAITKSNSRAADYYAAMMVKNANKRAK